jgi:hypothetical protein
MPGTPFNYVHLGLLRRLSRTLSLLGLLRSMGRQLEPHRAQAHIPGRRRAGRRGGCVPVPAGGQRCGGSGGDCGAGGGQVGLGLTCWYSQLTCHAVAAAAAVCAAPLGHCSTSLPLHFDQGRRAHKAVGTHCNCSSYSGSPNDRRHRTVAESVQSVHDGKATHSAYIYEVVCMYCKCAVNPGWRGGSTSRTWCESSSPSCE